MLYGTRDGADDELILCLKAQRPELFMIKYKGGKVNGNRKTGRKVDEYWNHKG